MVCESTPLAQRAKGRGALCPDFSVSCSRTHALWRLRCSGNEPHAGDNEQDGVVVAIFQRSFFVACMHCTFSCSSDLMFSSRIIYSVSFFLFVFCFFWTWNLYCVPCLCIGFVFTFECAFVCESEGRQSSMFIFCSLNGWVWFHLYGCHAYKFSLDLSTFFHFNICFCFF